MSFLSALQKQKDNLKGTETVVTRADGSRYVEGAGGGAVAPLAYGFVVDARPDDVPALIADHLYVGAQDCAVDEVLKAYNIKHVLSLGLNVSVSDVDHKFVQMLDLPETDLKPVLRECLDFIRAAAEGGGNVLVHCNAGVSRTATIAIAYLMHFERMQYEDAHGLVKAKRPAIQPNAGFKTQLKGLKPGGVI